MSKKNPGVAAVLSLIIMGGGQIYNGDIGKGFAFIFVGAFCAVAFFANHGWQGPTNPVALLFILISLFVAIYSVCEAYKKAQNINQWTILTTMKKCFYCAEMIKEKAIVCRYCHKELEASA